MVDYTGNAMPAPGYAKGGHSVDDELLYSTAGFTQKGVTLKPGQGVLLLGTLIRQDAATKQYVRATAANAEGLLRQTTNTGDSTEGQAWQANIVIAAIAKLEKVVSANSGVTVSSALGARVNEVMGTFKF